MSVSEWRDDEEFKDFARRYFDQGKQYQEKVKLPRTFHLRSLKRISGMSIRWTSVLSEHLELEDDDRTIAVFHQISMLRRFTTV